MADHEKTSVATTKVRAPHGKLSLFGILGMTFFRVTVALDTAIIVIKTRKARKYLNYTMLRAPTVAADGGSN